MSKHRARGLDRDLGTLTLNGVARVRWHLTLTYWRAWWFLAGVIS
ncbi:hypothetical protein SEA_LITTLETOKYO_58 [Arthrobacter phage LittleTokyo]|nr:hypothetical protein SEA_LITTLETOKYO_58 [Arthrobacter phage LittleTokyo]